MTETDLITVPGGKLFIQVRGSGPALVLTGSPMGARFFEPLAEAMAGDHTVVTHDPRGIGASTLDDPDQDSTPDLRADDLAAVLDAVGAGTADVFGSSGGAVTGLALVTRHPRRVRTLVAHEPPVLDLLPDAAARHATTDEIIRTFHAHGAGPAFGLFMRTAGYDLADMPDMPPPSEQDIKDNERFFAYELRGTTTYVPDIAALTAGPARIVVGIGAGSGGLLTHRTSAALAERLGVPMTEFPGDHGGFISLAAAFAERLRQVID
ncbi:alpha/beta hydrolase [Actinoplanes sp. NPDC051470]|uniref:alpha/beta fold hydrolase n=1 Tax=Actinoplanes sp. NPDC051470 TaxID=3157224 RepID=UPI003428CA93